MSIEITRITPETYALLDSLVQLRIHGRARNADAPPPDNAGNFAALADPNLSVFVALLDGAAAGWIATIYMPKVGRTHGRGYLYIDELWVAPAFRGHGVAKRLMARADGEAEGRRCLGVRLYVSTDNAEAIGLYAHCGYQRAGEAFFLEKQIPPSSPKEVLP